MLDTLITFRLKIIHNLGQIGTLPKTGLTHGLTKNFKALYWGLCAMPWCHGTSKSGSWRPHSLTGDWLSRRRFCWMLSNCFRAEGILLLSSVCKACWTELLFLPFFIVSLSVLIHIRRLPLMDPTSSKTESLWRWWMTHSWILEAV